MAAHSAFSVVRKMAGLGNTTASWDEYPETQKLLKGPSDLT